MSGVPWASIGTAVLAAAVLGLLALAGGVIDGAVATAARTGARAGVRLGAWRPLVEAARLLRQRRRTTVAADALLWRAAGGAAVVAALLMVAVVPLTGSAGSAPADLAVGVVWVNTMDVLVWGVVWLAGWGPNSAHALVGGYRFLALALAYELPLMFALTAPAVGAQSLRVGDVVAAQHDVWFVVWMPLAFAVYCVGVLGFSVSGPLAAPLGPDVAGGVLAESSGVDRLFLVAGRRLLLAAGALVAVPLFLGGGAGPLLAGWLWVPVKALLVLAALSAVKRRMPLLRPDRFAEVGWIVLLPVALAQLLVVAVVVLGRR